VTDLILFDLDGTLIDHRAAVLAAIEQVIQSSVAALLPPDDLAGTWWDLERAHMRQYLVGSGSSFRCWASGFPMPQG
jgi:phosphoglycolate phosphatase-like HAD superfamily hydrolase